MSDKIKRKTLSIRSTEVLEDKIDKIMNYYSISKTEVVKRAIDYYFWKYYNKEVKGYQSGTVDSRAVKSKQKEDNKERQVELIRDLVHNWTPKEAHDYMFPRGMFTRPLRPLIQQGYTNVHARLYDDQENSGIRKIQYMAFEGKTSRHDTRISVLEDRLNEYITSGELIITDGEFVFKPKF